MIENNTNKSIETRWDETKGQWFVEIGGRKGYLREGTQYWGDNVRSETTIDECSYSDCQYYEAKTVFYTGCLK